MLSHPFLYLPPHQMTLGASSLSETSPKQGPPVYQGKVGDDCSSQCTRSFSRTGSPGALTCGRLVTGPGQAISDPAARAFCPVFLRTGWNDWLGSPGEGQAWPPSMTSYSA